MLDFPNYLPLRIEHGEPFRRTGKCSIQINQIFFAALLCAKQKLMAIGERDWYWYNRDIWDKVSPVEIRNMLRELLEQFADETDTPELPMTINRGTLNSIVDIACGMVHRIKFPDMDEDLIPCRNTVLRWNSRSNEFEPLDFKSDMNIRSTLTVDYDPSADPAAFLEKLHEILTDEADVRACQEYLGGALFYRNYANMFLYLYGEGGSGKSLLILLLEGILGTVRTLDINIKALAENYELSALENQSLLVASESPSNASSSVGMDTVKQLVGGDLIQSRKKFKNERSEHFGYYSLAIISNHKLKFNFEGVGMEWKRRLIPVFFSETIKKADKTLGRKLLAEHGSGILNWFLEGASRLRKNNWEIQLTPAQIAHRDSLVENSHPVQVFIDNYVRRSGGKNMTSDDAWMAYNRCVGTGILPPLTQVAFFKQLADRMAQTFGTTAVNTLPTANSTPGRFQRGYRGFELVACACTRAK